MTFLAYQYQMITKLKWLMGYWLYLLSDKFLYIILDQFYLVMNKITLWESVLYHVTFIYQLSIF